MVLFKDAKKPVIKHAAGTSAEAGAKRAVYVEKAAPCMEACPSGTDVRKWLVAVAQHRAYGRTPMQAFEAAWQTILEHNPFPAICGRVCQHPCNLGCNRKSKDGAVAVNRLEQFIGDMAIDRGFRAPLPAVLLEEKIAVVGAGPAGLAAAYHLARKGYRVTLFDAAPAAGGMMRYRIPRTVIPAEILDAEIANILALGVELRTNCAVGRDVSVDELRRQHAAVFFAMGLQKAAEIELRDGADGLGVLAGTLPGGIPETPGEAAQQAEPKVVNSVSVAIAQGQRVAEAIAAFLQQRPFVPRTKGAAIRSEKLKLDWYKPAAPVQPASEALSQEEALAEAARCMSCGMCMDCETCWMYCSKNCFVKLAKGDHYKLKTELCNGCGKCVDSCPCGYIEMN